MSMVPPECAVGTAVHYFFYNWMCGLSPTLSLKTLSDGNLSIDVGVICSPVLSQETPPRRKRSGHGSRRRRKEKRAYKSNETFCHTVSTETNLPESGTTAVEAVDVNVINKDVDVPVTELSSLSMSNQSQELLYVPNTDDMFYSDERMTDDLIDLSTCLPNEPILTDGLHQPDEITCIDEWKDPTFSTPVTKSPLTISENASLSSPHIEAMMYAMVKELYRRTCT